MRYEVNVPFEVATPVSQSDPDVRSITRIPGHLALTPDPAHRGRYELRFEVEAGSLRDAMDAAEDLWIEYENALAHYRPRRLAEVAPVAR